MVHRKIKTTVEWIEDHLRRMCGEITPDKRIIVVMAMLVLFTVLSFYITISSIYRFGRGQGEMIQMRHIEHLQLELEQKQSALDSIKNSNKFYYERESK